MSPVAQLVVTLGGMYLAKRWLAPKDSAKSSPTPPGAPPRAQSKGTETPRSPVFGNVPPGFARKYYYGSHWVYEYPQNAPEHRFWLAFFSGAQGWSSNANKIVT